MKTYRIFIDVAAESKEDAINKINAFIDDRGIQDTSDIALVLLDGTGFRVQENPFDYDDEGTILELARVAITDSEVYDYMAGQLDLSDEYLKKLQEKIEAVTNRP